MNTWSIVIAIILALHFFLFVFGFIRTLLAIKSTISGKEEIRSLHEHNSESSKALLLTISENNKNSAEKDEITQIIKTSRVLLNSLLFVFHPISLLFKSKSQFPTIFYSAETNLTLCLILSLWHFQLNWFMEETLGSYKSAIVSAFVVCCVSFLVFFGIYIGKWKGSQSSSHLEMFGLLGLLIILAFSIILSIQGLIDEDIDESVLIGWILSMALDLLIYRFIVCGIIFLLLTCVYGSKMNSRLVSLIAADSELFKHLENQSELLNNRNDDETFTMKQQRRDPSASANVLLEEGSKEISFAFNTNQDLERGFKDTKRETQDFDSRIAFNDTSDDFFPKQFNSNILVSRFQSNLENPQLMKIYGGKQEIEDLSNPLNSLRFDDYRGIYSNQFNPFPSKSMKSPRKVESSQQTIINEEEEFESKPIDSKNKFVFSRNNMIKTEGEHYDFNSFDIEIYNPSTIASQIATKGVILKKNVKRKNSLTCASLANPLNSSEKVIILDSEQAKGKSKSFAKLNKKTENLKTFLRLQNNENLNKLQKPNFLNQDKSLNMIPTNSSRKNAISHLKSLSYSLPNINALKNNSTPIPKNLRSIKNRPTIQITPLQPISSPKRIHNNDVQGESNNSEFIKNQKFLEGRLNEPKNKFLIRSISIDRLDSEKLNSTKSPKRPETPEFERSIKRTFDFKRTDFIPEHSKSESDFHYSNFNDFNEFIEESIQNEPMSIRISNATPEYSDLQFQMNENNIPMEFQESLQGQGSEFQVDSRNAFRRLQYERITSSKFLSENTIRKAFREDKFRKNDGIQTMVNDSNGIVIRQYPFDFSNDTSPYLEYLPNMLSNIEDSSQFNEEREKIYKAKVNSMLKANALRKTAGIEQTYALKENPFSRNIQFTKKMRNN